jgi:2-succinyl-6-hydroxy-2,4-cyclohexadiene-1-carboxylate synthase
MTLIEIRDTTYYLKVHQQDSSLPDLLMLHGFMGDHRVFDHLIEELSVFCNPITPDLLGHGKSSKPAKPERYNEEQQIEYFLQLTDVLNSDLLYVSGYSMGGRLALQTALKAPNCFNGLILESTNGGIIKKNQRKQRQNIDENRAKQIEENYQQFLSDWQKLPLFDSPFPQNENLVEKYSRIQSEQSPEVLAASLRGFGTGIMTPVYDELTQLELPVLLLAGSEDEKYQQMNNYLGKQFPNATFQSIKAGHRVHLDNPKKFVATIKQFLNRIL